MASGPEGNWWGAFNMGAINGSAGPAGKPPFIHPLLVFAVLALAAACAMGTWL